MTKQEISKLKNALVELTEGVIKYQHKLDQIMESPETIDRKKVARLQNALNILNDQCILFGLGYSIKKMDKIKKELRND